MKFGFRKPSIKKSFAARTKGRAKRKVKKSLIPGYGRKGRGALHPKRAVYNKVYRKTTFGLSDLFKLTAPKKRRHKLSAKLVQPSLLSKIHCKLTVRKQISNSLKLSLIVVRI